MQKKIIISFLELGKSYGDYAALKDINLNVHAGEKVFICGPSGSGKSTLIRCVNGLEKYQSGKLLVNNRVVGMTRQGDNQVLRDTGMVFQGFNLFPHLTALENCMLAPRRVLKMSKAEAREIAETYLARVGLESRMFNYPKQLSGGQQQRVAIARTLCTRPKIILFDEPTSALDPEMVNEVLDVISSLSEEGITMMCVTHEMHFARKCADRIIFMDKGEIVETNTPEAFFQNPQTDRARQFIQQIAH